MINFEKLFKTYHVDYTTKQGKGWTNTKCCFCGGHSYKLGFNNDEEWCTCFACGEHPLYLTLSKLLNLNPIAIKSDIIPKYHSKSLSHSVRHSFAKELSLPTNEFLDCERKYLLNRHFNPDKLYQKFGVVGGGLYGDFSYRIILPLIYHGKLVSWTGRSILPKDKCEELKIPRYYNLSVEKSVMNPKDLFFNMDNATGTSVILVEGPFDVLRMEDDCICSFGTNVKQSQQALLADRYKKIFIAFDNEKEAQEKARHLGMNLASLGVEIEIVNFCEEYGAKDPAELKPSQVKKIKAELGF